MTLQERRASIVSIGAAVVDLYTSSVLELKSIDLKMAADAYADAALAADDFATAHAVHAEHDAREAETKLTAATERTDAALLRLSEALASL